MSKEAGPRPPLHPLINPGDLRADGKLLSQKTFDHIMKNVKIEGPTKVRRSKHRELFLDGDEPRSLLFSGKNIFTLYRDRSIERTYKEGYLGVGGFGKAKLAQDQEGNWLAAKILTIHEHGARQRKISAERDITILRHLGYLKDTMTIASKNGKLKIYIIMDLFLGKNLSEFWKMQVHQSLDDPSTAFEPFLKVFILTLMKLETLHQKGVLHDDIGIGDEGFEELNIGNLIIRPNIDDVDIIDFGLGILSQDKRVHERENKVVVKAFLNFISVPFADFSESVNIRNALFQKEHEWLLDLLLLLHIKIAKSECNQLGPVIALLANAYQKHFHAPIAGMAWENTIAITASELAEITHHKALIAQYRNLSINQFCQYIDDRGPKDPVTIARIKSAAVEFSEVPYSRDFDRIMALRTQLADEITAQQISFEYPHLFSSKRIEDIRIKAIVLRKCDKLLEQVQPKVQMNEDEGIEEKVELNNKRKEDTASQADKLPSAKKHKIRS
jgi:serine/threonine protein kinase